MEYKIVNVPMENIVNCYRKIIKIYYLEEKIGQAPRPALLIRELMKHKTLFYTNIKL